MLPSSSTSIENAAGFLGRPGIVIIAPVRTTINSAPAESLTSRTVSVNPVGRPSFAASSEREYCVFATQMGKREYFSSRASISDMFLRAAASYFTSAAPYIFVATAAIFSFMEKVNDLVEEKGRWIENEMPVSWINLFAADFIAKNIYNGESFKIPTDDSHYIYCEQGAKFSKMLGKIARKFDIPGYEEFRIALEKRLNN